MEFGLFVCIGGIKWEYEEEWREEWELEMELFLLLLLLDGGMVLFKEGWYGCQG